MTIVGIVVLILIIPWAWLTGRMSVKWKTGERWRVGLLYIKPSTRFLAHNLATFALPIIAALLLWHWALSPLAIVLGWGAFFAGSRREFREQVLQMASYMVMEEGMDPAEALIRAHQYLRAIVKNYDPKIGF